MVARVELSNRAVENLDSLIASHSLPSDTRARARRVLSGLAAFPALGRELQGRWATHRVVLGPWRWMLLVYRIDANDRVVVVTVQDARTSAAATGRR